MAAHDLDRFFREELPALLDADPRLSRDLRGLEAVAQIELNGLDGGEGDGTPVFWNVRFSRGKAEVRAGASKDASFGLVAHVEDFKDILDGAANIRACLVDGRLEIEGDLGLAVRLAPLLLRALP